MSRKLLKCSKCKKTVMHYVYRYRGDPNKYVQCNYCRNIVLEASI